MHSQRAVVVDSEWMACDSSASWTVIAAQKNAPNTVAIRQFNEILHHDQHSMLPIGDGQMLARKR